MSRYHIDIRREKLNHKSLRAQRSTCRDYKWVAIPLETTQTHDRLDQHQYTPTRKVQMASIFLQTTQEIYTEPSPVVSLHCSLTFNCNLLHAHMKATHCRCKSLMLHKHNTPFLPKVRPLMGKSCPSFQRTNALIQYGNNFSACYYLTQLPSSLL